MGTHMKTTLDISDELFLRAKQVAADRGVTLRSLVEAGLRTVLDVDDPSLGAPPPFEMITFRGRGLTPEYQAKGLLQAIHDTYDEVGGSVEGSAPAVNDRRDPA